MEKSIQPIASRSVKEERWQDLSDSLCTSRADGSTDVILLCQGKEYPAHTFILEWSSSYFKTMFQCGLNESKSRKVRFRDMEPETLEAILDYIYKGEVDMIKAEEQIKNVLSASHMLNLTKLFEYCCFMLGESLSKDNFYEIQAIVSTYEQTSLNEKILAFVVVYGKEKDELSIFKNLSVGQMKTILTFAKHKRLCFDKLLTVLIRWLQYDLRSREKDARELFACVDGQLVSKSMISSLLFGDNITSEIISQLLKDIALACTLGFYACCKQSGVLSNNFNCKKLMVTFFNEYFDKPSAVHAINVVQQFDVITMTWLPSKEKQILNNTYFTKASMCYFGGTVHMLAASSSPAHILYDIANNKVELRSCNQLNYLTGPGLCVFKNNLFVIGGRSGSDNPLTNVYCTELGAIDDWVTVPSMNTRRFLPTVLTSTDYIYVIGGGVPFGPLSAEYFNAKAFSWTTINCENIPSSVSSQHCFVFNNELHAVGFSNGQFECWFYNGDKWQRKKYNTQMPGHPFNITNVCQFLNVDMDVVLLSAGNRHLPTHAWKPFDGKWIELDPVMGLCEIPNYSSKPFVYCADV